MMEDTWYITLTGAYCWYNNSAATYKNVYGGLYNWYAVNTGKLCPSGWHVPDNTDWETLTTLAGGTSVAGGRLKEEGTSHWITPNTGATDMYGFTALPGGLRDFGGTFGSIGYSCFFWSATEIGGFWAWDLGMRNTTSSVNSNDYDKRSGFSIRCVKN
jgi:uncharacterized protein (TIGR02145 family)